MALTKFNPGPLPNPGKEWDQQYMRQVIRVLEIYFNQLESSTPNFAESYTADRLILNGKTTAEKLDLPDVLPGTVIYDKTLKKLCLYNGTAWQTITSV